MNVAKRFMGDRRGVAAVEFAFIAPIMFAMYFITMELAQGIETNKKVGRIGSMVADLITQQPAISATELDAILRIGASIIQPYGRSTPTIKVTAIQITATSEVKVAWSRKLQNGVFSRDTTAGTATTVPPALKLPDTFLVRVESNLSYAPVITWTAEKKTALGLTAAFDGIAMSENYYLRPRVSTAIACLDC